MTSTLTEVGPGPGTWYLDPLHSSLIFVARYLRFGRVEGTFGRARGRLLVAEDPAESRVEVILDSASVNTGVEARDAHLRSADFLDVDRHPEIRFVSTGTEAGGRGRNAFRLHGGLTFHGTTVPTVLDAQWVGEAPDYASPEDTYGHFFSATARISLADFGVGDGGPLPWGGRMVGDTIDIVLEVRVQDRDPAPFLRQIGHMS
ncbi:YceI family protein [Nocardiopsis quinghaiensis]|uniref:YceI family protein n=1 Tax=Nocardiopsis quinghaiensis TaxID=464995 RepID=UPI00123B9E92|nr:YceI family protein [Nocardiopsis quinghaiensis]